MKAKLSLLAVAIVMLASCKADEKATLKSYKPVSVPEANVYCHQILVQAMAAEGDFFIRNIDFEVMADRGLEGRNATAKQKAAIVRAFPDYLPALDQMLQDMENGGNVRVVTAREDKAGCLGIFRITDADGGIDYLEFLFGKTGPGDSIRILDIYSFLEGNYLSRAGVDQMLAFEKSVQETGLKPEGDSKEFRAGQEQLAEVEALLAEEDYDAANEVWEKLPASFKTEKLPMRDKLTIAFHRGDRNYAIALDEYKKKFPNDPSLDMLLIDKAFMDQDTAALFHCIDGIERRLGYHDAYLDVFRMNGYFLKEDCAQAVKLAQYVQSVEREQEDPVWVLMRCAAAAKDYKQATVYGVQLVDEYGYDQADIEDTESFPDLRELFESRFWRAEFPEMEGEDQGD